MAEETEKKTLDRRSFISKSVFVIAGTIAAGMGIPSIFYVIGQALQRNKEENWIRIGSKSKIAVGVPTLFKAKVSRQSGWIVTEEEISAFVITEDGRNFQALSNSCTHLGCKVRWISDKGNFYCPCHNGVFDKNGDVLEGPPPRPLDQYEIALEDDNILIKVG